MRWSEDKDDYLLISGIQHFMFCKHQWGLIHLEDVWIDNILTFEGNLIHEKVDNPEIKESRKDIFISRSVPVVSNELKIQGIIDLIEFVKDEKGIYIENKNDYFIPIIIEYKHGQPKEGLEDKVQLCAQAISFEEMKNCNLDYGYIYYHKINKREKVYFTEDLRRIVKELTIEMKELYINGNPTFPEKGKKCKNCSLVDICSKNFPKMDATKYINTVLGG